MTFPLEHGGNTEFRLEIEGWPAQYVTHEQYTRSADDDPTGRARLFGLQRDGLGWSSEVSPPHADISGDGFTARICDTQYIQDIAASLILRPSVDSFLTASVDATDTTFSVRSSDPFTSGTYLHIGTEVVKVTGKGTGTLTVARGQWGTTAQAHFVIADGKTFDAAYIADRPTGMEGRRAWLYVYGEQDDPHGEGNLAFSGVIRSDAKLDREGEWQFKVGHMASVLGQRIGADLADGSMRGIFYPYSAPLFVSLLELNSADLSGSVANSAEFYIVGFWETQAAFVKDLTDYVTTVTSGWTFASNGGELYAESLGEDVAWQWRIKVPSPANYVAIRHSSPVDQTHVLWTKRDGDMVIDFTGHTGVYYTSRPARDIKGALKAAFQSTYGVDVGVRAVDPNFDDNAGTVPRGTVGSPYLTPAGLWGITVVNASSADPSTLFGSSLWLSELSELPTNTGVDITINGTHIGTGVVKDYDVASKWVRFEWANGKGAATVKGVRTEFNYIASDQADASLTYGIERVQLGQFIARLMSDGPGEANRGHCPLILESDFSPTFQSEALAITKRRPYKLRSFVGKKANKLSELLQEECKLHGMYLSTDSVGRLRFAETTHPSATQAVAYAFDGYDGEVAIDEAPAPDWERAAVSGYLTTATFELGESGPKFVLRDAAAVSMYRTESGISCKPKSFNAAGIDKISDIAKVWRPILGYYSHESASVSFSFPITSETYEIALGSFVSLAHPNLINPYTGKRGATAVGVVSRVEWDFPALRGRIRMFVSYIEAAGYSPALSVTNASGSGVSWTLTCSTSGPASGPSMYESGETAEDRFEIGDAILLWEWDSATPTTRTGTVSSVSGNTVGVSLDSSWSGTGGDPYALSYDDAADADASQQAYGYFARSDGRIHFASDVTARRFAP